MSILDQLFGANGREITLKERQSGTVLRMCEHPSFGPLEPVLKRRWELNEEFDGVELCVLYPGGVVAPRVRFGVPKESLNLRLSWEGGDYLSSFKLVDEETGEAFWEGAAFRAGK